VVLFAGLGLGLFATELLIVLTRTAYLPAAVYVGFLAYMHIFGAMYQILYTGGLAGKHFSGITWAVLAGALVNLGLNLLLIPSYRLWGATAATFISYAVSPALLYLWLRRRYPVPYPAGRIGAALAVQLALLAAGLFIPPVAFPLRVGLKLLVWLLLPVAYAMIGMVTAPELQQARRLLRQGLMGQRPVTGG
jgi:O-antigen/teichoic acid export membrane protein